MSIITEAAEDAVAAAVPGLGWAKLALRFAPYIAIALVLGWGVRVDHLRGGYKAQIEVIRQAVGAAVGTDIKADQIVPGVTRVTVDRDQYQRERDNARDVVLRQSESITRLHEEAERLAKLSAHDRALAQSLIEQRNIWIERARAAETRTERLTADKELEEANAVLDALFDAGF